MATIKNAKLFQKFVDKIDSIEKFDFAKKSDGEVEDILLTFIENLKRNLEEDGTEASGALKASIAPLPVEVASGKIKIRVELDPHWKDVDQGQKPKGMSEANLKALQPKIFNWIQEKGSLAQIADDKTLKRSLSFAIAKSILKKGTIKRFGYKGSRFVTRELPEFKQSIITAMSNAFRIT